MKIVTVSKVHECLACGKKIQIGIKAINENGHNESQGYFNSYFHLVRFCAGEFVDIVQSSPEEKAMIEEALIPEEQKIIDNALQQSEKKKEVETLI